MGLVASVTHVECDRACRYGGAICTDEPLSQFHIHGRTLGVGLVVLLPDILTVDTSLDTGYLNGRNPVDDVIDASSALVSGGAITTDCVDNDSTFLSVFPYLGVPN